MSRWLSGALLVLVTLATFSVEPPPQPQKRPVAETPGQAAKLAEGIRLHEMKQYPEAIALFKQVLTENPDSVVALHELAFSYFSSGDYERCLDAALTGCSYDSAILSRFYTIAGNALGNLERGEEALKFFAKAVESKGADYEAFYNYAVELSKADRKEEATHIAQRCSLLKPDYASNHLLLASLYHDQKLELEALLACMRFLDIEPDTARSDLVIRLSQDVLSTFQMEVKREAGDKEPTIVVPGGIPNDIPNFRMSVMVGITYLSLIPEETIPPSAAFVITLGTTIEALSKDDPGTRSEFAFRYYGSYFKSLAKKHHADPFARMAYQRLDRGLYAKWIAEPSTEKAIKKYRTWSAAYQWPSS